MGRRRRSSRHLPFKSLFFKSRNQPKPTVISSPWPWPASCNQPKTLSFRLHANNDQYVSNNNIDNKVNDNLYTSMKPMSSSRLLLDYTSDKSSCIRDVMVPFEGSVAVEMESRDLYEDFRVSMKEMVEAHSGEMKGLVWFEEMVEWYLRMNKRWTHEYIVMAYWDLLLEIMIYRKFSCSASLSSSSSSSSNAFASSSSYFSCLEENDEIKS